LAGRTGGLVAGPAVLGGRGRRAGAVAGRALGGVVAGGRRGLAGRARLPGGGPRGAVVGLPVVGGGRAGAAPGRRPGLGVLRPVDRGLVPAGPIVRAPGPGVAGRLGAPVAGGGRAGAGRRPARTGRRRPLRGRGGPVGRLLARRRVALAVARAAGGCPRAVVGRRREPGGPDRGARPLPGRGARAAGPGGRGRGPARRPRRGLGPARPGGRAVRARRGAGGVRRTARPAVAGRRLLERPPGALQGPLELVG